MASQQICRIPDAISDEEMNLLKLFKMILGIAPSVLYKVFLWGTKQKENESVEHYLLQSKGYSKQFYRKCFDQYQITLMSDRKKECEFDISTIYKVIKHTCDKLDDSSDVWKTENDNRLEWLLTEVKRFRNDHSHKFVGISVDELIIQSNYLMDLLRKVLTVAGKIYGKTDESCQELEKMETDIITVRDQMLTSEFNDYEIIRMNEKLKYFLKINGAEELRKRYENLCQLNPVYFLDTEGVLLDVDMVFTQIEVENAGQKEKGLRVSCHEILTFCSNNTTIKHATMIQSPEVYLIEGPAGAGKTTLMKYIKSLWSKKDDSMLGLDDYDLLLFMECRNPSLSSLSELLCQLMPKTYASYFSSRDEMLKFTLDLQTLILVDGLDELNSSSQKLFLDIINQHNKNLVVLCTSRPEKARHFKMHVPPTFHTAYLKIIGIADNRKEEFVRKYHREMWEHGKSKQDTESLIRFIKKSESHLRNHFRLPLNLVLLAWLWADNPASVTPVTTSCELYIQTHNLMKKKLLERLAHHENAHVIDFEDLEKKIKEFLCSAYKAALLSLNEDAIESLLPESVDQMKTTCKANNLPPRETLSAFFVIKVIEGEEKVSVPHKLLHDFYAAQCIVQNLFHENEESKNKAFLQQLNVLLSNTDVNPVMKQYLIGQASTKMEVTTTAPKSGSLKALVDDLCRKEPGKMNKYQSMLLLVAGIIYALHGSKVQKWIAKEIVELLKDSELGLRNDNEWFDLFDLTKNDVIVISHVSKYISNSITITDARVEAALLLLQEARPRNISVSISRKTKDIPELQDLMRKIANCESHLDLGFWQDFWQPDSLPSNDQEVRTVSQRCSLGKVVCHVSGGTLAEMRGTSIFLTLAVTSDLAAQEIMSHLINLKPEFQLMGLCLHLTTNVSPGVLREMAGIHMLCLVVSEVLDSNLDIACEMAKAILPHNSMLLDLRFPWAKVTYAGCMRLLKNLKQSKIRIAHVSIPEEVVMLPIELECLKKFAHKEVPLRCAFRRLNKEQMEETPFSDV